MPAREWWTCSIPSACARSGILAVCLIACRRNAARMSMIPFSLVEMCAKSMCYNRRAYAPRTRVVPQHPIADVQDRAGVNQPLLGVERQAFADIAQIF